MSEVINFALLGLGVGAVYVLLGQGLVLVYRGSGVINFAHGGFALLGAFIYYEMSDRAGAPVILSVSASVLACAALGALVHVLIMRPLRKSSPLARVIATLGVLIVLQAGVSIRYGVTPRSVDGFIPEKSVQILGFSISSDRLWLTLIALSVTAILWAFTKYTRLGLASQAVAENRRAASSLGWSPDLVATINWAFGGALAALAGMLVVPLTGLQIETLTSLVVAAMAAALFASFRSYWMVLVAGMMIGVIQSEIGRFVPVQGLTTAVPFLVILTVVIFRGSVLPLRDTVIEKRPEVGTGSIRPKIVIPIVIGFVLLSQLVFDSKYNAVLIVTCVVAIMLLSIVVLTGYAGQLSLAQYSIGGVGAWFAGRSVVELGWPFEAAMAAGVFGAVAVGALFGLPALRTRGVNLAVVTLGLGTSIHALWLGNTRFTGGDAGTVVGSQTFLGFSVDPITSPQNYATFCLIWLAITAVLVANVRRSSLGRRLLAVRTNERAAASLGIDITKTKLAAFMISSALAGIAGVLLAFTGYAITYQTTFDPFLSITAVTHAVIGGVGFIAGPLLGSTLAPGGIGTQITDLIVGVDAAWLTLAGGVVLILILIQDANGLVSANLHFARKLRRNRPRSSDQPSGTGLADLDLEPGDSLERPSSTLDVTGLTVRYGAVTAVSNVDLKVEPGQVVGLIGANGAGKTSVIDALTGFTSAEGEIKLDGQRLDGLSAHRRARAGLSRSFQSLELFEDVSVAENLLTAATEENLGGKWRSFLWPRAQRLQPPAVAALREFNIVGDLGKKPDELPFGRRRLVAIARALASGPAIVLLDEPAAGLDETETAELTGLIRRLADDWGLGVLLVEHDMSLVMAACDRITVLDFGAVVAEGTPDEISRHPAVRLAYLGESEVPSVGA